MTLGSGEGLCAPCTPYPAHAGTRRYEYMSTTQRCWSNGVGETPLQRRRRLRSWPGHQVPMWPQPGTIAQRLPEPAAFGLALLEDLCVRKCVSARDVALLVVEVTVVFQDGSSVTGRKANSPVGRYYAIRCREAGSR